MKAISRPTKMTAAEAAAVRKARKGDKSAVESVFRMAEPFVYYNCLKFVGSGHEQDAQDLTQETLLKAYSRLGSLDNNERFLSWVLTITLNTCKDFYRKKRDYELFSDTDEKSAQEIYEEMPDEDMKSQTVPEKKVDNEETQKMIRDIVNELPDEQRIAVTLTYYDFLTSREIAQQLNVNENTVKYRLASARRKIHKRIEEYKAEGIKLYNVAPASFLSYLSYFLSNEAKEMSEAIFVKLPVASLMAALSEAGLTIGVITGSTAGTIVSAVGAALSGVGVFLSAAGGKIVAIIVMTALVVGATESASSLNNLLFQSKPDRVEVEESTFSGEDASKEYKENHESSMSESETSPTSQTEMSSQQESSSTSESSSLESQVVYETSSTAQSSENTEQSSVNAEASGNASTGNSSGTGESSNNNNTESSNASGEATSGESSESAGPESSATESSTNESSTNESSANNSSASSTDESSGTENSTNESSAAESSTNESSHTHTYEETNRVVGENNPDVGYTTTITYTCSECGDTYSETVEHLHTFEYYTSTGPFLSSVSDLTDPEEVWNEWMTRSFPSNRWHDRYCTDTSCAYYEIYQYSGQERIEDHDFVFESNTHYEADCTKPGYSRLIYRCSKCKQYVQITYNVQPALGHDYQDYTRSTDADGKITIDCTCARCNTHHIYIEQSREVDADGNTTIHFMCSLCHEDRYETFGPGEVISERETGYLSADRLFVVPERFRLSA